MGQYLGKSLESIRNLFQELFPNPSHHLIKHLNSL